MNDKVGQKRMFTLDVKRSLRLACCQRTHHKRINQSKHSGLRNSRYIKTNGIKQNQT